MKPIRITTENLGKIQAVIDGVEAGTNVRKITATTINIRAGEAEDRLAEAGVPKKLRSGARAKFDPWVLPNRYRYEGKGTIAVLERRATGWFLIAVIRETCDKRSYGRSTSDDLVVSIERTDARLAAILRKLPIEVI